MKTWPAGLFLKYSGEYRVFDTDKQCPMLRNWSYLKSEFSHDFLMQWICECMLHMHIVSMLAWLPDGSTCPCTYSMITQTLHVCLAVPACTYPSNGGSLHGTISAHFGWGTEQRRYKDQRQQPVNPFVVPCFKEAVTQCRLSTVTQLLFLASIYVDAFTKLGRNAPQAYIAQETSPSSPQCSYRVLTVTEMAATAPPPFFFFDSVDSNPSGQGEPFCSYIRDGAFSHTHLCCRTNKTVPGVLSKHTSREP